MAKRTVKKPRRKWTRSPATKVKPSARIYNRKKIKSSLAKSNKRKTR